jgi:hypothetical protein
MALVDYALLDRLLRSLLGLAAMSVVFGPTATAADDVADDAPELDFLAYLGSWQESDEEWLAVAEWEGEKQIEEDALTVNKRKDDEH